jgi:hypothetical protein
MNRAREPSITASRPTHTAVRAARGERISASTEGEREPRGARLPLTVVARGCYGMVVAQMSLFPNAESVV